MIQKMNEIKTADLIVTRDGKKYVTFLSIYENKNKYDILASIDSETYIDMKFYNKKTFKYENTLHPEKDIVKIFRPRGFGGLARLNDIDKTHYLIYQRKPEVKSIKDKMSDSDKNIAKIYLKQGYNFVARNSDKICFFKDFPKKKNEEYWSDGEMQYAPDFVFSWLDNSYPIDLNELKLTRK